MADPFVADQWLAKAEEDFGFANTNLEDKENEFFSQICFHFQQAAEKYLKAFIVANDLEFSRIHDLEELVRICQKKEARFSQVSGAARYLTDFYIDTRYPVVWAMGYTRQDAERAHEEASRVRDFVRSKLEVK